MSKHNKNPGYSKPFEDNTWIQFTPHHLAPCYRFKEGKSVLDRCIVWSFSPGLVKYGEIRGKEGNEYGFLLVLNNRRPGGQKIGLGHTPPHPSPKRSFLRDENPF